MDQLGERYEVTHLSAKPYPCCRLTHGAIDAALSLVQEHGLKEGHVKEVVVETSPVVYDTVGHPFQIRDNPQVDAQFSIAYTVAVAIQRGKVFLDDFEEEVVRQPATAALAKKVLVRVDERLPRHSTVVTIYTTGGKVCSKRIDVFKGHPENPLRWEEFLEKFRECARYSAIPISGDRLEEMLACLQVIDRVQDIDQLLRVMVLS
jgi:2-methylcitrate dehydratase PrpD